MLVRRADMSTFLLKSLAATVRENIRAVSTRRRRRREVAFVHGSNCAAPRRKAARLHRRRKMAPMCRAGGGDGLIAGHRHYGGEPAGAEAADARGCRLIEKWRDNEDARRSVTRRRGCREQSRRPGIRRNVRWRLRGRWW